jgi:hypothetical protein
MMRLTSLAVAMLIGVAPMAQAMTCQEQMAEVSKMIDSAIDAAKKQAAMQDMEMAKQAMAKLDESGCVAHVQTARKKVMGD